nr:uncharacterized protein LOC109399075 [Aedes albopictus]XP_029722581.1 uncharacterized protein LOC109399075 [Aedes albopictus]XP_029722582.1 uncharacterized protein LOC109399075 [Aedes albopictus]XP_029722583.1 uncharacterized protein LOC109426543 [Aedes albopictus]XP_029722584.1 uncharacterized protein LOC109426543 [Aedes albopictus]
MITISTPASTNKNYPQPVDGRCPINRFALVLAAELDKKPSRSGWQTNSQDSRVLRAKKLAERKKQRTKAFHWKAFVFHFAVSSSSTASVVGPNREQGSNPIATRPEDRTAGSKGQQRRCIT